VAIGLPQTNEKKRESIARNGGDAQDEPMPGQVSTHSLKLSALLEGVETIAPVADGGLDIRQVACDSRKVEPRALFFALHGAKADGNAFIREAVSRGAVAIASEDAAPAAMPSSVTWIRVREARKALAAAAANFFAHPARALKLVAVTGTNGKTTTTSLVDAVLKASGAKTGLFGTIAYHTPLGDYAAPNTTPESIDLQGFFAEIRGAGGRYGVLEASSHALAMDRLWGCHFAAAVFTNLTREHMDYHKTFEDYFAAKRRLFEGTGAGAPDVAVETATMNMESDWRDWRRTPSPTVWNPRRT
jgi:UDP-N-acetylmuramoyl-L-alanyl-D-glutamate--2,6-diaminopimelate ligase